MSLFTSFHFVNFKQYEVKHAIEVDCVKLSEKYTCHGQYSSAKSEYFQSQCSQCKQYRRLKKNIKFVDKLFKRFKCLFISWNLNQPLFLLFSNGSMVNMEFNDNNNTLLRVDIDNNLCGKFLPYRIVDVIIHKNCIYITYVEPKLTLVCINQDSSSLFHKMFGQKKGKLKIVNVDLLIPTPKSFEKRLALNMEGNFLLVWWRNCNDVWPWTPLTYLTDRVNGLLYLVNGTCIELISPITVQGDLLHASFSQEHSNQLFTLEGIQKEGQIIINICVHEIVYGISQIVYTTQLPLRGNLIACHWSLTEDKLLAADSEGCLLVYDAKKKSTVFTNLENVPKHLSWHPQNCIALIVSENNHIICLDAALNAISLQLCHKSSLELKCLELGSYFSNQIKAVQKVLWQESVSNDTCLFLIESEVSAFVFLKFSFGIITRLNVTAYEIISQYLKSNSFDKAILILESLDWCSKSDVKFMCLSKIVNFLLRKPLNFHNQAMIELALGAFYDWVDVLPERIVEMYQVRMHHLARRFFHHLLRYCKFRKAFLLAVDLEAQDLFFDLHHVAKQQGENILANVSLLKAEEFDNSSESASESCSSDCHSEYQNSVDCVQIPCVSIQTEEENEAYHPNVELKYMKSIRENSVIEENEEMEGTQIRLAHLGVI